MLINTSLEQLKGFKNFETHNIRSLGFCEENDSASKTAWKESLSENENKQLHNIWKGPG